MKLPLPNKRKNMVIRQIVLLFSKTSEYHLASLTLLIYFQSLPQPIFHKVNIPMRAKVNHWNSGFSFFWVMVLHLLTIFDLSENGMESTFLKTCLPVTWQVGTKRTLTQPYNTQPKCIKLSCFWTRQYSVSHLHPWIKLILDCNCMVGRVYFPVGALV